MLQKNHCMDWNQTNQYEVPFVKSALNFTVLAQKLLSKKLLLLITIFIIMTLHFVVSSKEIKYLKTLRIIYYDENPVASHASK
jgi:hypothetical protein